MPPTIPTPAVAAALGFEVADAAALLALELAALEALLAALLMLDAALLDALEAEEAALDMLAAALLDALEADDAAEEAAEVIDALAEEPERREEAAEDAADEREEMMLPPPVVDWAWAETAPRARTARRENFIVVVMVLVLGLVEVGSKVGDSGWMLELSRVTGLLTSDQELKDKSRTEGGDSVGGGVYKHVLCDRA